MRISKRLEAYRRYKDPSLERVRSGLRRMSAYLLFFLVWSPLFARWTASSGTENSQPLVRWWVAISLLQLALGAYALITGTVRFRRLLAAQQNSPSTHAALWAWAHFLFSSPIPEMVFLPLLSDLELEETEAVERHGLDAAHRIVRSGHWIFWRTVGVQLCRSALSSLRPLKRPD